MIKSIVLHVLLLAVLGFMNQSCDDPYIGQNIMFENRSDENIYVGIKAWDTITPQIMFDYESMPIPIPKLIIFRKETIYCYTLSGRSDSMHILVYKQSTLDKYTTDELIEQNIYDKRYDLTSKDLKAMNFTIVYTGD